MQVNDLFLHVMVVTGLAQVSDELLGWTFVGKDAGHSAPARR